MDKKKMLMVDTLMLQAKDFRPVKLTEAEAGEYSAHWVAPIWNIGNLNLNGRIYTQALAERIVNEAKATGVCDGHEQPIGAEYDTYKAVAKNPRIDGGQLIVDIYFIDDGYCRKLDQLLKLGVTIGVSSVGYGETDQEGVVDPQTYELIRYCDFVQYPANNTYATPENDTNNTGDTNDSRVETPDTKLPESTAPAEDAQAKEPEKPAPVEEQKQETDNRPADAVEVADDKTSNTKETNNMEEKKKEVVASDEKQAMNEAQKNDAARNNVIVESEKYPAQAMSESRQFVKRIIEAVTVGTSFAGTVPTEIATEIVKKRDQLAQIRGIATVHKATGDYKIAVEGTGATVAYSGEGAAITESTPDVSVLTLSAYKIAALVKASREVLTDPAVDVQQYLVDAIGKAMAEFEENEFLNGTGATNSHITGILTTLGLSANGAQLITAAGSTALTWDDVAGIDAKLGAYAPNATIIMNSATASAVRQLKDGAGHYIFAQNEPLSNVLGHKVLISQYMPSIATGTTPIVAGDFSYYHIADRLGLNLQVLNELYAANDQVGIKATERLDAAAALAEAFVAIKMA